MQIVIRHGFGGYGLSEFAAAELGCDLSVSKGEEFRTSAALVDLLEVHGSTAVSGFCANLEAIEIPDCASDWDVYDNDSAEWVAYVVDGKLCDSRFPSRRRTNRSSMTDGLLFAFMPPFGGFLFSHKCR